MVGGILFPAIGFLLGPVGVEILILILFLFKLGGGKRFI
jgi:hypothetical protein